MKILICDDDKSTIEVIKNNIDFSKYGITEIYEAYNGEMSIKVFDQEKPQLVLCDIGMPKVDGIEVLMHCKTTEPLTEFCFLTCYESFEYAHKAIEYEASGYITKPFKLQQVEIMIEKMVNNYNKNKPNSQEEKQFRNDLIYQTMFKQMADGIHGNKLDEVQNYLKNNDIEINASSNWKIVFTCLSTLETISSTWSKELLIMMVPRIHDEIFNDYAGSAHSIVDFDDRFIWCLTFVKEENFSRINENCLALNDFCYEHFQIRPVMLISNPFEFYKTADVVSELYRTMRKIRFYAGKVFNQDDDISKFDNQTILDQNQILWYIKNRDVKGYEEHIKNILTNHNYSEDIEKFKNEVYSLFLTLLKDNDLNEKLLFNHQELNEINKQEPTKKNAIAFSKKLIEIYIEEMSSLLDSDDIITRAKKFVDDNYRNNIDRDDVAEVAFVTPNYLSKLFKNSIGMNLREYINKLRVEESKRLLLSTNMSITEIAIFVGYYNISYFSTIFHRMVGVSPADWRNKKED